MKYSRSRNTRKKKVLRRGQTGSEQVRSIRILNKNYFFDDQCSTTWLNSFSKISNNSREYILSYDENNIEDCLLGQGGSGFVLKYENNGDKFAIKFLTNKSDRNKEVKKIQDIQRLFTGSVSSDYRITQFIEEGDVSISINGRRVALYFIVMDLADGTINDLMCQYHKSEDAINNPRELIFQIKHLAETIRVLHQSNYAHRDIKPENILLKGEYPILSDFGLSGYTHQKIIRRKGPKYWPNPEFVQACDKDLQDIDEQSDIFNLGCLFFYFFTGKYPIGRIDLETELKDINPDIKNLLLSMISYSKTDRLSDINDAIEVFEHAI